MQIEKPRVKAFGQRELRRISKQLLAWQPRTIGGAKIPEVRAPGRGGGQPRGRAITPLALCLILWGHFRMDHPLPVLRLK
jgi:hypothetical protein